MNDVDRQILIDLGRLAAALREEHARGSQELAHRLAGLLGQLPDALRAARLRELAGLLFEYGEYITGSADELDQRVG